MVGEICEHCGGSTFVLDDDGSPKYSDLFEWKSPPDDFITKTPEQLGLVIDDSEYDAIEIPNLEASKAIGEDLVKVVAEIREKDIQKSGIICLDCYKDTDFVIWGVHKTPE